MGRWSTLSEDVCEEQRPPINLPALELFPVAP